jgi:crossover junction endodeoxyribonuclease RusA
VVTLELPYPPSVNSIWRHGRGRSYLDKKYEGWKLEALSAFRKQKKEQTVGTPIKGAFEVFMTFSEQERKWNSDLDNRIKATMDALQDFKLIENDSKCQKLTATWGPVDGVFIRAFKFLSTPPSDSSSGT